MWSRGLVVAVTLASMLGSDLAVGISLAQTGGGPGIVPPLSSGDGTYGKVLPGPGTAPPYLNGPQQPAYQMPQQSQPSVVQRPAGPVAQNLCQPAGRSYQTVSVPRSREPVPFQPQAPTTTVTQVSVSQGAQGIASQPASDGRAPAGGQGPSGPDVDELSRIEAGFNLDPMRPMSVPGFQGQYGTQRVSQQLTAQQLANQQGAGLQQVSAQQQGAASEQAFLGPYGAPLRQYGYAMFASNVSTFAPVDDIPVGPDYVLGPGDDVTINVWGTVDSTLVRTVDRNGRIVLPKVGDLRIWGLSFAQADRLIRDELARYFRGFQTSVTMGRLRAVNVYVVGEVCQPGVYTLSSLSTVTNALFSSGGPTKLGSLREVRLIRGGYQVARLDLYDFLQRGDRTRDYRLESGDTIFVPPIGDVVAVAGEVKRPAIYEIRSDTRLADVVSLAGGVTPTSYLKRVQVVRALPSSERITVDVDLTGYYLKGDEATNPPVNGGDLVLIHRSDPRIYNTDRKSVV